MMIGMKNQIEVELAKFRKRLIDLRDVANKELEGKNVGIFHFSGEIITGKTENLDTLFIGINPGGGDNKKGIETVEEYETREFFF